MGKFLTVSVLINLIISAIILVAFVCSTSNVLIVVLDKFSTFFGGVSILQFIFDSHNLKNLK